MDDKKQIIKFKIICFCGWCSFLICLLSAIHGYYNHNALNYVFQWPTVFFTFIIALYCTYEYKKFVKNISNDI